MDTIKVLFLASEADPLIKVGGLGDVAGSLPRALMQLSPQQAGNAAVDIRLAIPFHHVLKKKIEHPEFLFDFEVPAKDGPVPAQAYHIEVNYVPGFLLGKIGHPVRRALSRVDGRPITKT